MKKRKLNKKRIILFLLLIILVFFSITLAKNAFKPKPETKGPKIINEINGYELREDANSYYKNVFNELKEVLSKSKLNEEEYAKIISKLFISDVLTLENKISHTDVGGVQFIYEPFRNDFILIASESLYNHIENNLYGNRKQELPNVSNVEIISLEKQSFEYLDKVDDNAYLITAKIEYIKNMDYPDEVSIILIHNNNKLEVAEME